MENLLDQPSEKRSAVKKDIFIKGRQGDLPDVTAFVANILTFARFWVKMTDKTHTQSTIIQMIIEIADFITTSDFRTFHNNFLKQKPYLPHTLIAYIFNIFFIFIAMAKNPKVIRKFKCSEELDPKELKMATLMTGSLIDQLRLCSATCSPQNLFAQPPASLRTFCPHLTLKEPEEESDRKRKIPQQETKDGTKKPAVTNKGSIENKTGKRLYFPKGLSQKYCSDFLDSGSSCRHGFECNFVHAVYPSGFSDEDVKIMEKWFAETPDISMANQQKKKVS